MFSDADFFHFLIWHFHPFGIVFGIQLCGDCESGFGGGIADKVDDHFVAGQWFPAPIYADMREDTVFDFIPFAGAWREMTDRNFQTSFIGQLLQGIFPQAHPVSVTSSTVCCNQ